MTTLGEFELVGNRYESEEVQFNKDAVLEINFQKMPPVTGIMIQIYQSLTLKGWHCCYTDTLRQGKVWCKTLVNVSENAYYKIVCTEKPQSVNYE